MDIEQAVTNENLMRQFRMDIEHFELKIIFFSKFSNVNNLILNVPNELKLSGNMDHPKRNPNMQKSQNLQKVDIEHSGSQPTSCKWS